MSDMNLVRLVLLGLAVALMIGVLSACASTDMPVEVECAIPAPPPELLRIPDPLPPIPVDIPRVSKP
jgi:hypothetical protein